jgi:CARDB protein
VVAVIVLGAVPGAASQTAAGAVPTAGRGPAHARPPYAAQLASCHRSPRIAGRSATVAAMMRPVPGGTHLALRIALYQRPLGAGRWTLRSDVPGLGVWTTPSDPALGSRAADVFKYRQAVARLVVPFAYRFRVEFRWSDGAGNVVRRAAARTAICREPDLRPDLTIDRVDVTPMLRASHGARYAVTIRNAGRSAARGVLVAAAFPSNPAANATHSAGRLAAGASKVVTFSGPACSSAPGPPSFTVDPSNAIEESREDDNALAAVCPATAATLGGR